MHGVAIKLTAIFRVINNFYVMVKVINVSVLHVDVRNYDILYK
jgi:hypothetical protein